MQINEGDKEGVDEGGADLKGGRTLEVKTPPLTPTLN